MAVDLGGDSLGARWLREVSAQADDWVNLGSNPATSRYPK